MDIRFEWDPAKALSNRVKHGVSFETAVRVFADPLALSVADRVEGGEQRWQTIGLVEGWLLLLVAHSWCDDDGLEVVRIISARRVTAAERRRYDEGQD